MSQSASPRSQRRKRYSITISTGAKELQANHLALYTPDLKDVVPSLQKGLDANFKNVEIKVFDKCPDLSEWGNLTTKGICGSTRIAEVGGVPYLYAKKHQKRTKYQLPDIVKACGMQTGLVFGAAHASQSIIGKTGELAVNSKVPGPRHTRYCKIDKLDAQEEEKKDAQQAKVGPCVNFYPSEEVGCTSNLFICDGGNDEPVLYIKVSQRTGKLNITNAIRTALAQIKGVGGATQIGVGGVIKVTKGKVKTSIAPDFVELDWTNAESIEKSRKYFEFGPNLIMFSTFLTDDPSENNKLHLTLEATNCYSLNAHCAEGGCFVESVSDDTIEYEGYFSLAKYIYRVEDAFYNLQLDKK
eukprot:30319_1